MIRHRGRVAGHAATAVVVAAAGASIPAGAGCLVAAAIVAGTGGGRSAASLAEVRAGLERAAKSLPGGRAGRG